MKKILISAVAAFTLSACSSGPALVNYEHISTPPLNQQETKFLGEKLLEQGKGIYGDSITLGYGKGAYSQIKPGKYCQTDSSSNRFYSQDVQAVTLTNLMGMPVGYSSFVTYDKQSNKVCPNGGMACYDSSEISIEHQQDDICYSANAYQQVIEYNGKSGDILNFTYREFSNDMARSAFTTDFKMDLNEGDTIGYKGARLQVLEADNSKITYKVIANFNKQ